jgi:hypothetical protein
MVIIKNNKRFLEGSASNITTDIDNMMHSYTGAEVLQLLYYGEVGVELKGGRLRFSNRQLSVVSPSDNFSLNLNNIARITINSNTPTRHILEIFLKQRQVLRLVVSS